MKLCTIIFLIMVSFSSFGLTTKEVNNWKEDINFYSNELVGHHIDPFHSISKDIFYSEIERIKNSLSKKTTNEVLIELMRLTHSIGDGHTSFPLWGKELNSFPLALKMFEADLYVVKTTSAHKTLLGAKLISVNGVPSAEIVRLFSKLAPFSENEFSTAVRVAEYIPNAELLNGLGIIPDSAKASFTFEVEGKIEEHHLNSSHSPKFDLYLTYTNNATFSPKDRISEDLWFGASADNKTIYLKFRRYTSISKMEDLAENLLSFIKKNNSENLIIDLRDNYGGDFFVGLKLAQLLVLADSLDWKSGVYVLIDNVTFSAAMSNAAQFTQILNATLVGTPTGARPSGYQDMGQFTLPNSNLEVTYSKRLYHFKENPKNALYPDVNIEISMKDYKNKNDMQLNWTLNNIQDKRNASNKTLHGKSH
jgi:Peptidase family S41